MSLFARCGTRVALNVRMVSSRRTMSTGKGHISASEVLSGIPWSVVTGALVAKLSWDLWDRNIEHDYGWQNVAVAMGATPKPEKKKVIGGARKQTVPAKQTEQRSPTKIAVLKHVTPETEAAAQDFFSRMYTWVRIAGPVGSAVGAYVAYTTASFMEAANSDAAAKLIQNTVGKPMPNMQSVAFTGVRTVFMGIGAYVGARVVYEGGRVYFETCDDKVALKSFLEAMADGTKWGKWNKDGTLREEE